jgi:hypothetical protein
MDNAATVAAAAIAAGEGVEVGQQDATLFGDRAGRHL